jgi:hypothetical protein
MVTIIVDRAVVQVVGIDWSFRVVAVGGIGGSVIAGIVGASIDGSVIGGIGGAGIRGSVSHF